MSLCEGEKGETYRIRKMNLQDNNGQKLQALGFTAGTIIKVISRKKTGALIVETGGKQVALCNKFAAAIDIE